MADPVVEIKLILTGTQAAHFPDGTITIDLQESLERMALAIEELQTIASDYEARITALEP